MRGDLTHIPHWPKILLRQQKLVRARRSKNFKILEAGQVMSLRKAKPRWSYIPLAMSQYTNAIRDYLVILMGISLIWLSCLCTGIPVYGKMAFILKQPHQGTCLNIKIKCHFTGVGIPITDIRGSNDHLSVCKNLSWFIRHLSDGFYIFYINLWNLPSDIWA